MASLDVSAYSESLSSEDKSEYFAKLTLETGERLPDPFMLQEGWTDNMSCLPSLSWRDVTEYLIDSPSIYTKESMKAYKSLEAYDYFLCKHVQDCFYHNITEESDFCYIKTEVLPSQRQGKNTSLYKVWVCLHKANGWILTGNCTCMAGLGSSCSHLAALLFKLEAAVHYQLNEKIASTSQLCSWKASRRQIEAVPASAIDFSRPKKRSLPKSSKMVVLNRNYSCSDPTSGTAAITKEELRELKQIYPMAAVFTSLPETVYESSFEVVSTTITEPVKDDSDTDTDTENDSNCIPEPIVSLFDPTAFNMSDEELTEHGRKLYSAYCSSNYQNSFDNLCRLTERQSQNRAWMVHRAGRITASVCYQVAKMKNNPSLIKSIMQYKTFDSKYTKYGRDIEPLAKKNFVSKESVKHSDFHVKQCGLIVDATAPFLGASPDGLVYCSCHGQGILEIKCPYKYKDCFDGWEEDNDFPLDDKLNIKIGHKYYYQMQLQMELAKTSYGYLFVFCSKKKEGMKSVVKKDNVFVESLKHVLFTNFCQFFLPEILTRKMDSTGSDRKTYCTCKRPEFGNMISCGNIFCNIKRFHYPCVNITRKPKRDWFCIVL